MRALVLAVGVGVLVAACGRDDERADVTELAVTVWPDGRAGGGEAVRWTLTCDPPGGTHPSPAPACAALAANEEALEPVPADRLCTQIFGGPQVATVEGVYRGRPVSTSFNRVNGCEIERWNRLAPVFGAAGDA